MTEDGRGSSKPSDGPAAGALDAIARAAAAKGLPPVEAWNPPYCGDIGLEIRADGRWWYQGTPILRQPLVRLFASVLRKDGDGKTYLVTPVEKIAVTVADAPFLAVEMDVRGSGREQVIAFRTNFDDWIEVSAAHPLRFAVQEPAGGLKPYILVRGRLEALVVRSVYLELATLAECDSDGTFGLWSAGRRWLMA